MAKCKNCKNIYNLSDEDDVIVGKWCPKTHDSPDIERERDCKHFECMTNADRIRSMSDEQLAELFAEKCKVGKEFAMCWLQSEVKGSDV